MSESWQADKWTRELGRDELTPMWADWKGASHRHFYVNEPAQLKDGQYILPLRWIVWRQIEHVEAVLLSRNEEV
jgi:hypothetical protein